MMNSNLKTFNLNNLIKFIKNFIKKNWWRSPDNSRTVPLEWRQSFEREWIFINYTRCRLIAWVSLWFPVILLILSNLSGIIFKDSRAISISFTVMVVNAILSLIFIICTSYYKVNSSQEIRPVHYYLFFAYSFLLTIFVSTIFYIVWWKTGFNPPYIIGIFTYSLIFYYPSYIRFLFYPLNFIFYNYCIFAFDHPFINKLFAYISGSVSTVIALAAASILFNSLRLDFMSKCTIEQQFRDLHQANEQLQRLASTDRLTQVANRLRFDEYLEQEWQRLTRSHEPISLIICDVDFFKLYNDTYGHQAGDICLQKVAMTLQNHVRRAGDLLARYGGEEFVVILPNTPINGALSLAEVMRSQVENLKILHNKSQFGYVTISMGVSCIVPAPHLDSYRIIGAADKALYTAKKQGRNQVVYQALKITGIIDD